jgi:hypothetical protein
VQADAKGKRGKAKEIKKAETQPPQKGKPREPEERNED